PTALLGITLSVLAQRPFSTSSAKTVWLIPLIPAVTSITAAKIPAIAFFLNLFPPLSQKYGVNKNLYLTNLLRFCYSSHYSDSPPLFQVKNHIFFIIIFPFPS